MNDKGVCTMAAPEVEANGAAPEETIFHPKGMTKDQFLSKARRVTVPVEIPEWGGRFYLTEMTIVEADELSSGNYSNMDMCVLCAMYSVTDENGNRLFTKDDLPQLRTVGISTLRLIEREAMELNGLTADAFENIEGNSEADQTGNSD